MPFFDHYPYTNMHNVNLDWVLQAVKSWGALVEQNNQNFINLAAANEAFKEYVTGYITNLDVQEEINNKLDQMLESGALTQYFSPYIKTDVEEWLEENITPTTPAVDASLSIAGAAADAKATGDAIRNVRIETDPTLSIPGDAADAAAVGEAIEDIDLQIYTMDSIYKKLLSVFGNNDLYPTVINEDSTYYQNSLAGLRIFIGDKIYPAGTVIKNIKHYSVNAGTGYIIIITTSDVVHDIIPVTITANTVIDTLLNKIYDVDVKIGLYNTGISYKTTQSPTYAWSHGLVQAKNISSIDAIPVGTQLTVVTDSPNVYLETYAQVEYLALNSSENIIADTIYKDPISSIYKWQPYGLQTAVNKMLKYADCDTVQYTGRWYDLVVDDKKCKVTNNGGSAMYLRTEGATTLTINWEPMTNGNAYFAYTIDGGTLVRQSITNKVVTLPDNGIHYIRVITDGILERIGKWDNGTGYAISGVSVNAGTVTGAYPINPQIMFIGDSIVEGTNALGSPQTVPDQADVISATGSFAWYCAEKINCVPFFIGYGGSGIAADGSFKKAITALNYLWSEAAVALYHPDAILIEHGTNDTLSSADFITEYKKLLDNISVKYPGTRVYIMIPFNQDYATEIRSIASDYTWCKLIDTDGWYSGPTHPVAADGKILGERLAGEIIDDVYGLNI